MRSLMIRLAVVVQADAARLVGARALEAAGLDLERGELSVAVRVDPLADRIAVEGGLDFVGAKARPSVKMRRGRV